MSNMSTADRFIALLLMKERAQRAVDELASRPSDDPRFALSMVIDSQTSALHAQFAAAWETLDRVRQVAAQLAEQAAQEKS